MPRTKRLSKSKKRFKKSWDRFAHALGRRIVVYLSDIESECPNCYYDKVNRTSSGVPKSSPGDPNYFAYGRCPVCHGKGVITTSRRRCIDGVIVWNPSGDKMNALTFTEAGYEGATVVEIKTDPCNLDIIKNSKFVIIDSIQCKLATPPILRGIGEKQILIAYFFTVNKPKKDNGERIN